eukprot:scaffold4754_cov66-Cylindrotheca_fusiformis.AAC.2
MKDLDWIEVSPVETEFWFKNESDSKFVASIHKDGGIIHGGVRGIQQASDHRPVRIQRYIVVGC